MIFDSNVNKEKVVIKRKFSFYFIIAYYNILKFKEKKQTNKSIVVYFFIFDKKKESTLFCSIVYFFGLISCTNQSTFCIQYPCVKIGHWVQIGDLLLDGQASLFGCFSVGQNLLITYMSWDRLNFEDGVITTQKIIDKENFTSVHSEKWYVSLTNTDEVFIPFVLIFFSYIFICFSKNYRTIFFSDCINLLLINYVLQYIKMYTYLQSQRVKVFFSHNRIKIHSINKLRKMFPCTEVLYLVFFLNIKSNNMIFIEKFLLNIHIEIQTIFFKRKKNWNSIFSYFEALDIFGFIKKGIRIVSNQILILRVRKFKIFTITHNERLFFDISKRKRYFFIIKNVSFRVPFNLTGRILNIDRFTTCESILLKFFYTKNTWKNITEWFANKSNEKLPKKHKIRKKKIMICQNCVKFASFKNVSLIKNTIFIYRKFCYIIRIKYQPLRSLKKFTFLIKKIVINWFIKRKDYTF